MLGLGAVLSAGALTDEQATVVVEALLRLLPQDCTPGSDPSTLLRCVQAASAVLRCCNRWSAAAIALALPAEVGVLSRMLELGEAPVAAAAEGEDAEDAEVLAVIEAAQQLGTTEEPPTKKIKADDEPAAVLATTRRGVIGALLLFVTRAHTTHPKPAETGVALWSAAQLLTVVVVQLSRPSGGC